jgi:hypothetical protein
LITGNLSKPDKLPGDLYLVVYSHHTRVKISSRYESCLLPTGNTAALLTNDI